MSGWVLEAPGKAGSARRLAWLEAEYARLGFECQYLEAVNGGLNRKLHGFEDDDGPELPDEQEQEGDVVSLDQVDLEDESDMRKISMGTDGDGSRAASKSSKASSKARRRISYEKEEGETQDQDLSRFESGISVGTGGMEKARTMMTWMGTYTRASVMKGSALGKSRPAQAVIYAVAFAFVVFVLIATSTHMTLWAGDPHGDGHGDGGHGAGEHADPGHAVDGHTAAGGQGDPLTGLPGHGDDHHRRLGGAAPALLKNIAFSLVGAGLIGYFMNILKQPLIIGYLLGGVLVGPVCLGIVDNYSEIDEIAELGLLFLLFMMGMELDFHKLFKMSRVVIVAGFFQFPICAGIMYFILSFLQEVFGLTMGTGDHPKVYIALTCSVSGLWIQRCWSPWCTGSSTMIVTKMLAEKFEADSPAGKLTQGILMCQDIWAIVILAVQPTMSEPQAGPIIKNFIMIAIIGLAACAYAKFVMPPVLLTASKSVELMLVLSLSWCFFICSMAILPFVGLSMELAAIIAGCALATFPYSQDFNGKIKYIRDFFITLFFAGVGMQVPLPTVDVVGKAVLVVALVTVIRWIGIFVLIIALGGEPRQGALATINLSQVSEFAIVICSMGIFEGGGFGHVAQDTMTIVIWAFAIMALLNCYAIYHSQQIVRMMASLTKRVLPNRRQPSLEAGTAAEEEAEDDMFEEEGRDIVLLGFHRIASMLIAEFQLRSPKLLHRIHVIDINPGAMASLREKGIKCSWGDFASAKELKKFHKGECSVVISSIPDSLLHGVTNMKLLKVSRDVWPDSHFIATADNPYQAQQLYEAGADYVVRMAKLCAERLHELLTEHCSRAFGSGELSELFETYKHRDRDAKGKKGFLSLQV